jgi:hypothetical protein
LAHWRAIFRTSTLVPHEWEEHPSDRYESDHNSCSDAHPPSWRFIRNRCGHRPTALMSGHIDLVPLPGHCEGHGVGRHVGGRSDRSVGHVGSHLGDQSDGSRTDLVCDALERGRLDAPVNPLNVATPLLPCIHVLDELLGHVRAELDHLSGFAVRTSPSIALMPCRISRSLLIVS